MITGRPRCSRASSSRGSHRQAATLRGPRMSSAAPPLLGFRPFLDGGRELCLEVRDLVSETSGLRGIAAGRPEAAATACSRAMVSPSRVRAAVSSWTWRRARSAPAARGRAAAAPRARAGQPPGGSATPDQPAQPRPRAKARTIQRRISPATYNMAQTPWTMSSMRRLRALFSGVSFGTNGSSSPRPRVVRSSAGTSRPTR